MENVLVKNRNLISVRELLSKKDEDFLNFIVPSYQRGYRWDERQVKDLLDDFLEFLNNKSGSFYCLQPIVVKKNGESYILVDGQQRLTTVYLILKFLKTFLETKKLDIFQIIYDEREYSNKFLESLDVNFPKEISSNKADEHYMSKACVTISKWFEKYEKHLEILGLLTSFDDKKCVKFIWYELDENEDERELFSRVNSGKIPLTNAELTKASFLIESKKDEQGNEKSQIELAKEWDEMEYYLQNDKVWHFLVKDEKYPTRIELLFEIYLQSKPKADDPYKTHREFNERLKYKEQISNIWQEIKKIFLTLRYWYEDKELYHLIGFLIATKSSDINTLYKESKGKRKSEFLNNLKKQSKSKLNLDNIENLSYGENNEEIEKVLLFFNIATILSSNSSDMRFSFDKFNLPKWSLEHINPQTEFEIKGFEDQNKWLENNRSFLDDESLKNRIDEFKNPEKETEKRNEKFNELKEEILNYFYKGDIDNI